jgi:hypothetical protein
MLNSTQRPIVNMYGKEILDLGKNVMCDAAKMIQSGSNSKLEDTLYIACDALQRPSPITKRCLNGING